MGSPTATLDVGYDGVAVITLRNPPVNALHPLLLQAIFNSVREAQARPDVKAIVITGASGKFSAGFDIKQFQQKSGGGGIDAGINEAFSSLVENGPKPTVAAIEGLALGGGLELAMSCNARVCTPGTSLGLPELSLGILPGFGGTQRLPRLVGLEKACEMMLTSKPIKSAEAKKLGLIDEEVPKGDLLAKASQLALDIANGKRARLAPLFRTDKLPALGDALMILDFAAAQAAKRAPGIEHPQLCLGAIRTGIESGPLAGLKKEQEAFAKAASLDVHKALVHIFFAQRSTKHIKGVTGVGLKARPIKKVAVIGGGLMGSGIATACILVGIQVVLKEVNQQFLDGGMARIKSNLESRVKRGGMKKEAVGPTLALVQPVLTYDAFGSVDLVVEAVIEDLGLKQRIFADLERVCKADAILSTNTSTIDISLVGAKTRCPERIIGAHFFSPAHIMPLLEIVRSDKTSKQAILDVLEWGSAIKKTPVVVGNCTGFAVNRVFFPYTMAACMLLDLGLDPYKVDRMIAGFGMPMGPFRLSDLVGADIGLHVGKNFIESFPDRVYPARIIQSLNQEKRLGEKTGSGFYAFDAKRKASPDPKLAPLVEAARKAAGLLKPGQKPLPFSPKDVVEFIFFPVVNEGCRVIEEGIVDKPADLDVASVMAMGFPPHRGGLIKWADLVGPRYVVDRLNAWAAQFEPAGLAGFFKPCKYLLDAANAGTQLEAGVSATSHL